jgi:GTPase Era involved in 16S rRNA processing
MQVHIPEFKERQRPAKDYIHAQIMVERESQVGTCTFF